jgi:transposase
LLVLAIDGSVHQLVVLKDHKKDTVKSFLKSIPTHLKKQLNQFVLTCMMIVINAAKEVFGKRTKIVIDRFHVAN